MIIFTHIAPEYFERNIGMGVLDSIRTISVYNLTSLDIRYPSISDLIPTSDYISEEYLNTEDSVMFEEAYFNYLNSAIPFQSLMLLLVNEFERGASHLTIVETKRSSYRDFIVECLQKYLYLSYGLKTTVFADLEDWDDLRELSSAFAPHGIMRMDQNMQFIHENSPDGNWGEY